jgi:TPR repeat protein
MAVRRLIKDSRFEEACAMGLPLARAGSVHAQLCLGYLYHTGKGVPKDLDEAERWYRQAFVDSKSPIAAYALARLYDHKNDLQQSHNCLEAAASEGYPAAMYTLGRCYSLGRGVPRDVKKGWDYTERAAREGHVWARRRVALEMLQGHRGFRQIPLALLMLWRVVRDYVRIESEGAHTELTDG